MSASLRRTTFGLALLALAALPSAAAPGKQTLPLINDDYARALSEARARKVPIFIEAWAPW